VSARNIEDIKNNFITICTQNRKLYFKNDKIKQMVDKVWQGLKNKFNNVNLDEYIIMPNHLHGIVVINNDYDNVCNRRGVIYHARHNGFDKSNNDGFDKSNPYGIIL